MPDRIIRKLLWAASAFRANRKNVPPLVVQGVREKFPSANARSGVSRCAGGFCPIVPDMVWALGFQYDQEFQYDQTAHGRALKLLNALDRFELSGTGQTHRAAALTTA